MGKAAPLPPPVPGDEKPDRYYADGGLYFRRADTGEYGFIKGAGSMADFPLDLIPGIDLTQPIYEQVLKLEK